MTYLEGRAPARILEPGTFPVPGVPGSWVTYGHDAVLDKVRDLLTWGRDFLAVDIETEGLAKASWYIKCVQVGHGTHAVIFDPRDEAQFHALRTVLNESLGQLVIHNSSFDVTPLVINGIMDLATIERVTDTLIYARMAEPDERSSHRLPDCMSHYLGWETEDLITARAKRLGISKVEWFRTKDIDSPAYRWDAATDVLGTARLFPIVRQAAYDRLTVGHPFAKYGVTGDEAWRLVERPQRVNRVFLARNAVGFRWDPEYLDRYRLEKAGEMAGHRDALIQAGIRPGVNQDLLKVLDNRGQIPEGYPRTKSGLLSGDKKHLEILKGIDLVKMFTAVKEWEKSDKDYMAKVADLSDRRGRVHPSCVILGAQSSGRMSYQGIPFHQFDAAARGIIAEDAPGDGVCSVDWTQQEPVIAANLAGDTKVLRMYEDATLPDEQRDMYRIIGEFAHIMRKQAKIVILAQMYGQGLVRLALGLGLITPADALAIGAFCNRPRPGTGPGTGVRAEYPWPMEAAEQLGIYGVQEAAEIKDRVWDVMPGTRKLVDKLKKIARDYKVIFTLSGRILPIPSAWYRDQYGAMTHKGMNFTIQGGAADMLEETVIRCVEAGLQDALMIAMHDELVVKRDAAHDVSKIMQQAPERLNFIAGRTAHFRTDVADLGDRWGKPE